MMTLNSIHAGNTGRTRELKLAILAVFSLPVADALKRLAGFQDADWHKALWWLDITGMALYFLDHAWCVGAEAVLPAWLDTQLHERLERNRARTEDMLKEAALLTTWLEAVDIPHVILKGITLFPHSVPDPALRWQADLDLLIPEKHAGLASHYISRLGYRLHARSGKTLEYRAGTPGLEDLTSMYSSRSERALELHLCAAEGADAERLKRREMRTLQYRSWFSLSAPDILVQQAQHLLKHLSGEHTRISWVLEFWRNVRSHRFDDVFWEDVERTAATELNGDLSMAVAFWLAEALFGSAGMVTPSQWQGDNMRRRVRLWLELYAVDLLLADQIGSKLYALLKQEIPGSLGDPRSLRQVLFPSRWPMRIATAAPNEGLSMRCRRYRIEFNHLLRRLKFHFIEGIWFAVQSARWKKAVARCEE